MGPKGRRWSITMPPREANWSRPGPMAIGKNVEQTDAAHTRSPFQNQPSLLTISTLQHRSIFSGKQKPKSTFRIIAHSSSTTLVGPYLPVIILEEHFHENVALIDSRRNASTSSTCFLRLNDVCTFLHISMKIQEFDFEGMALDNFLFYNYIPI